MQFLWKTEICSAKNFKVAGKQAVNTIYIAKQLNLISMKKIHYYHRNSLLNLATSLSNWVYNLTICSEDLF
jgi:hypothetical protein